MVRYKKRFKRRPRVQNRGWRMLDCLMSKDPANTLTVLHAFGIGVSETILPNNELRFKTYVKNKKGKRTS